MSEEKLDLKMIAKLLEPEMKRTADAVFESGMKGIGSIVDACLDGKCDVIATRTKEKLRPDIQEIRERLEKMESAEPSTLSVEDITKTVKEALEGAESSLTVQGHSAHDILDCPTCKPLIVDKLWASDEYRQGVMEKICEDDACRESMTKMFTEKGLGVAENVGKDESWAQRRLRERRERNAS